MSQTKQHSGFLERLSQKQTITILIFFTILDLIAGFLYWLHTEEILPSRFFNLSRDRGFGEIIQYAKFGFIIYMLHQLFKERLELIYRAWFIFFIALLLDDSLGIHEFIGKILITLIPFDAPGGLRAKDIAEIVGFALIEGVALFYVFLKFLTASKGARKYSLLLFCSLCPLIISGIILDSLPYAFIEQAGEMIGGTIVLCFVHWNYNKRTMPGSTALQ